MRGDGRWGMGDGRWGIGMREMGNAKFKIESQKSSRKI
jgi:hypothetical protein